jgi:hypothetical protein
LGVFAASLLLLSLKDYSRILPKLLSLPQIKMAYNYNFPFDLEVPLDFPANMGQHEQFNLTASWLDPMGTSIFDLPTNYQMQTPRPMASQNLQGVEPRYRAYEEGPMNRFINEPQRESGQVFAHGMAQPSAPIHSLPRAGFMRNPSPSRSLSHEMSSASSVQSPGTDLDWSYYPQNQDFDRNGSMDYYPNSPPSFASSPPAYESRQAHVQTYTLPQTPGNSCVNMSQVQGFADPQEVTFEADEGYAEMDMKAADYNMESEKRETRMETRQATQQTHLEYNYHTDSAVGSSMKDPSSPPETSIHVADDTVSDIDAEGEVDEQDAMEVDATSDTDYNPHSTRSTRKRTSTAATTTSRSPIKRTKVVKSTPKSTKSLNCKSCDCPAFRDAYQLSRHIASAHTRPYVCVFSFAGCPATFASKNEWKRHVSSQHLNFTAYVCELGACGQPNLKSPGSKGGAEFNRKDLFTQHLKRMHVPKRKAKTVDDKWEKQIKDLQISALKVKRHGPARLRCPMKECAVLFEGANCWDERMEHVGKHLERAAATGERDIGAVVDQGRDHYLVDWSVKEHIIELKTTSSGNAYKLCVGGHHPIKKDEDEDADGELE